MRSPDITHRKTLAEFLEDIFGPPKDENAPGYKRKTKEGRKGKKR